MRNVVVSVHWKDKSLIYKSRRLFNHIQRANISCDCAVQIICSLWLDINTIAHVCIRAKFCNDILIDALHAFCNWFICVGFGKWWWRHICWSTLGVLIWRNECGGAGMRPLLHRAFCDKIHHKYFLNLSVNVLYKIGTQLFFKFANRFHAGTHYARAEHSWGLGLCYGCAACVFSWAWVLKVVIEYNLFSNYNMLFSGRNW